MRSSVTPHVRYSLISKDKINIRPSGPPSALAVTPQARRRAHPERVYSHSTASCARSTYSSRKIKDRYLLPGLVIVSNDLLLRFLRIRFPKEYVFR